MNKFLYLLAFGLIFPLYGNGKVFLDQNGNGVADSGEPGIAGAAVSNGKEIVFTQNDGSFSFKSPGYWTSVSIPDKYLPTTSTWKNSDSANCAFGFKSDENYNAGAAFIHGSDIQFPTTRKRGILRNIVKTVAAAAAAHKTSAAICVGDITTHGQLDDMQTVRDEFAQNKLLLFPVFGGHDGVNDRSLGNYRKVFGPLWYSWNFRGVHFAAFVSENFLSKEQQIAQYKWLKEDLKSVSKDTPVILVTHAPGQASKSVRESLAGREPDIILGGHYHNWNIRKTGKTHIICSAPWREGDNGTQTVRVRVIKLSGKKWQSFTELVHPLKPQLPQTADIEIKTSGKWNSINGTENNGRVIDKKLTKIVPVWCTKTGSYQDYYGSPVISEGKVFCAVSDQNAGAENAGIVSLDARNGKILWKTLLGDDIAATPAIAGENIYAVTCSGNVFALKKSDGSIVWKNSPRRDYGNINNQTLGKYGWQLTTAPVCCADGKIFCQSNYSIRALDAETGKELWQIIRDSGYSPAAGVLYHDKKLYAAIPKQLLVIDPVNGKVIKSINKAKLTKLPYGNDRGMATVSVYNGNIYFPGQVLRKFSADCRELWAAKLNGARYAVSQAVEGSGITLAAYNNFLCAFDAASGKQLWSNQMKTTTGEVLKNTSAPVIFKDKALYASDNGTLNICELSTGKILQSIQLGAPVKSSPAASGNLICVSTFDGRVIGFAAVE